MFENFKADLAHFAALPGAPSSRAAFLRDMVLAQGVWAVAVYRFGNWVHTRAPRAVALPCKLPYLVAHKVIEMTTGISIPARTTIGPGLYIGHFGGIIVHAEAVIGAGCSLSPGVVIGTRGGGRRGLPRLGDNVYLGNGAKILGPVHIGDEARIGANAVVVSDVPPGATAIGVPAEVRTRGEPSRRRA